MTPAGLAQLRADEGCRLHAYPDPISGGAPWTIGYGCTGAGIGLGVVWTMAQAEAGLLKHVQQTEAGLQRALPWFAHLQANDPARADVLVNMAYNMGVAGLLQFDRFLAAMRAGQYAAAAAAMRLSKWFDEVPERARRLAAIILGSPPAQTFAGAAAAASFKDVASKTVEIDV
ncbi:MAG: glycoside hydrolase family protein [Caulobacteraceae bacterium]